MKTMFSTGLPSQNMFWMGQNSVPAGTKLDNVDDFCDKLEAAVDTYTKAVAFKKNPNYRQMIGDQAATFDDLMAKVDPIYDSVVSAQGSTCLGGSGSIGNVTLDNSFYFIGIANSLAPILASAKTVAAPTAAAKGAPAPASSGVNPLLIGGVAAGALLVGVLLFNA